VSKHLRRFHNRTDLTLVPTHELARELIADGYRNVDVLARGVDTQLFSPGRRSPALRESWGVASESLVVAYVGRVAAEKNLSLVTEAFDAILDRHPDARLLFVGDGPLLARLERRHPRHLFAGLRRGEDLATHYASADLFLFPSLTETFGNVVPEAMASGLGVVAFACAAAADLIEDGRNGRTVAAGDRRAFIEAAVALAGDRQRLAELGRQAAAAATRLGWEHIHEGFSRKLTELQVAHQGRQHGQERLVPVPDSGT
jgi:glycosyltransferase involved in cell wall biosynthesis